jgi:hypothetical protein
MGLFARYLPSVVLTAACMVSPACSGSQHGVTPTALEPVSSSQTSAAPSSSTLSIDWSKAGASVQSAIVRIDNPSAASSIVVDRIAGKASNVQLPLAGAQHTIFLTLHGGSHGMGQVVGETALSTHGVSNIAVAPDVGGSCASIAFSPVGDEPFVEGTPSPPPTIASSSSTTATSNNYTVAGPLTETFVATPEDAAGDPIVPLLPALGVVHLVPTGLSAFKVTSLGQNEFNLEPIGNLPPLPAFRNPTQFVPIAAECLSVTPAPLKFVSTSIVYIDDVTAGLAQQYGFVRTFDGTGTPLLVSGSFLNAVPNYAQPVNGPVYDPVVQRLYFPNYLGVGVYDLEGNPVSTSGSFPATYGTAGVSFDTTTREIWVNNYGINGFANGATVYDENGNLVNTITTPTLLADMSSFSSVYDSTLHLEYIDWAPAGPQAVPTAYTDNGTYVSLNTFEPAGTFPGFPTYNQVTFDPLDDELYAANGANIEIYNPFGYPVSPPSGAFSGLQGAMGIAFDTAYDRFYVVNCPGGFDNPSPPAPSYVSVFDQNGAAQTLPAGAFSGIGCGVGVGIVPP